MKPKRNKIKKLSSSLSLPNITDPTLSMASQNGDSNISVAALPSYLIIDCSMFSYIDTSGVKALKSTVQEYESIGIKTLIAGCASHVNKILEKEVFYAAVPENHVYISIYDAVQHVIEEQEEISGVIEGDETVDEEINNDDNTNNYI